MIEFEAIGVFPSPSSLFITPLPFPRSQDWLSAISLYGGVLGLAECLGLWSLSMFTCFKVRTLLYAGERCCHSVLVSLGRVCLRECTYILSYPRLFCSLPYKTSHIWAYYFTNHNGLHLWPVFLHMVGFHSFYGWVIFHSIGSPFMCWIWVVSMSLHLQITLL